MKCVSQKARGSKHVAKKKAPTSSSVCALCLNTHTANESFLNVNRKLGLFSFTGFTVEPNFLFRLKRLQITDILDPKPAGPGPGFWFVHAWCRILTSRSEFCFKFRKPFDSTQTKPRSAFTLWSITKDFFFLLITFYLHCGKVSRKQTPRLQHQWGLFPLVKLSSSFDGKCVREGSWKAYRQASAEKRGM